jgi:MFS family permease
LSWRWVFYVNLPIGIIGAAFTLMLLWETGKKDAAAKSFDLPGFITMAIAFGSFIAFLSKGQENGWLQSDLILSLVIIFCISLPLFIWIELHTEKPLFDVRIFKYRDFTMSVLCMFFMSIAVYGIFMLIPWLWFRTGSVPVVAYAILVNVLFFLASYPSAKRVYALRRTDPRWGDPAQAWQFSAMGRAILKLLAKFGYGKSRGPSGEGPA